MKIVFLLLCIIYSTAITVSFGEEDCSYLRDINKSQTINDYDGRFNKYFFPNLCEFNNPIHTEIREYLQEIKNIEGKGPIELLHDTSNVLCIGTFGECDKESFYWRFSDACTKAREKTIQDIEDSRGEGNTVEETDETNIDASFGAFCTLLGQEYIEIYMDVAIDEIGKNHKKNIEQSTYKYDKEVQKGMNALNQIQDTFIKVLGNIIRSIQGFTPKIFH